MVSMIPESEKYNYTYKWINLCKPEKEVKSQYLTVSENIYDILKRNNFKKITGLISLGNLENYMKSFYSGMSIFVTEDKNIPDNFYNSMDTFTANAFINSYILPDGVATPTYLANNGDSVYNTRNRDNPLLVVIDNEIRVNNVGKILYSLQASNGIIHVMDNIAQVQYVNSSAI